MNDLDHGGKWDFDDDGDVRMEFDSGPNRYLSPADVRRMAEKLGLLNPPKIVFRDVTTSIN